MRLTDVLIERMMAKEAGILATGKALGKVFNDGRIAKSELLQASKNIAKKALRASEGHDFLNRPWVPAHRFLDPVKTPTPHRLAQLSAAAKNRLSRLEMIETSKALASGLTAAEDSAKGLDRLIKWTNAHNSGIRALNKLQGDVSSIKELAKLSDTERHKLQRFLAGLNPY